MECVIDTFHSLIFFFFVVADCPGRLREFTTEFEVGTSDENVIMGNSDLETGWGRGRVERGRWDEVVSGWMGDEGRE